MALVFKSALRQDNNFRLFCLLVNDISADDTGMMVV